MNVIIITIGDEILIGQIVDTNSAWMAQVLNKKGVAVTEVRSISDSTGAITEAVDTALKKADVILMTGGLGPTKDDITKKTLADYFGVGMEFHQETYERILKLLARFKRTPTEGHRLQCNMPTNATVLTNKRGTAPGMWFEKDGKTLISMPGVPHEMKYLMEHEVIPRIVEKYPTTPIIHRTVLTAGEGESRIAETLTDFETNLPKEIKLAYLPGIAQVRLRLSAKGNDESGLKQLLDEKVKELESLVPDLVFGYDKSTLAEAVGDLLVAKGKTIGTAESCTGGTIAKMLTKVPGSSRYYEGSVVAYSYDLKKSFLNVKKETLETHGAVSEETVIEMVNGALNSLKTDIAIAVSGIAGPGGGTDEKPVGTIWLAIGNYQKVKTLNLHLGTNREANINYTSVTALNMIRKFLLEG